MSLDAKQIATLERLAAENAARRVTRGQFDGGDVWIKRYDVADRQGYALLHRLASLLPLPVHLKPSTVVAPGEALQRTLRKSRQFASQGFSVPQVMHRTETVLFTADAGTTVLEQLNRLRQESRGNKHAELLTNSMTALAAAHRAGLCHGRPHPRDMFLAGSGLGFMDFDEEPETVMPLELAQARDVWLLSLLVADLAETQDTAQAALAAYRDGAPPKTLNALDEVMRFWHPLIGAIAWTRHIREGADLRRMIKADRLLTGAA